MTGSLTRARSTSSRDPSGLTLFGIGKLVSSPLFDSGVTVPISGDDRAAVARRLMNPLGTIVSALRRMMSPCVALSNARLTLPTNPRLRALVITSTQGSLSSLVRCFAMRGSGVASSIRIARCGLDFSSGSRDSRQRREAMNSYCPHCLRPGCRLSVSARARNIHFRSS